MEGKEGRAYLREEKGKIKEKEKGAGAGLVCWNRVISVFPSPAGVFLSL